MLTDFSSQTVNKFLQKPECQSSIYVGKVLPVFAPRLVSPMTKTSDLSAQRMNKNKFDISRKTGGHTLDTLTKLLNK